jgi:hypothetical protein
MISNFILYGVILIHNLIKFRHIVVCNIKQKHSQQAGHDQVLGYMQYQASKPNGHFMHQQI